MHAVPHFQTTVHVAGIATQIGCFRVGIEWCVWCVIRVVVRDDCEARRGREHVLGATVSSNPAIGVKISAATQINERASLRGDVRSGKTHIFSRNATSGDVGTRRVNPRNTIEDQSVWNEQIAAICGAECRDRCDAPRSERELLRRCHSFSACGIQRRCAAAVPAEVDLADGCAEDAVLFNVRGVDIQSAARRKRKLATA